MKLEKLELQPSEKEGQWFTYQDQFGVKHPKTRLKLASANQIEFRAAIADGLGKLTVGRRGSRGRVELPTAAAQRQIETKALAEHVLLDWEGIEDDAEKPFPVSADNKARLLEMVHFRAFVIETVEDAAEFKEEELGNSKRSAEPSSG